MLQDTVDQLDETRPPANVSKRGRATLACLTCRRKRIKCSGEQPTCAPCRAHQRQCEWSWEDKRKPYTKEIVEALKQQIANLERQLAELSTTGVAPAQIESKSSDLSSTSAPAATSSSLRTATSDGEALPPKVAGGLARNAHGELRFFGPGSTHILMAQSTASRRTLEESAAHTLTRAPYPLEIYSSPPPRPPELEPSFQSRLLRLAFDYALSTFCIVDERRFYADMIAHPHERTAQYSPFMLGLILGIGCRYLDPREDFPREICTDPNDPSTRGDVFIHHARYSLEAEWNWPKISTLRGLACLALYLNGRGLDGLAWLYMGMGTLVAENFGMHLTIDHLSDAESSVDDELAVARRDGFFAIYSTEALLAMHIGRNCTFRPEEFDQVPGPIDPAADFDPPLYRSSAFHWSSKLAMLASKVLSRVYTKRGVGLPLRRDEVPALHLELQTWYHSLPSHIKVSSSDANKSPHPFIIGLNLFYWHILLYLHRPFFSRFDAAAIASSTDKCLLAASHIVRLVKVQQKSHGVRLVHPGFVQALFSAGTILALSSTQRGISPTPQQDKERQEQSAKDLKILVGVLREVGRTTWTSATTSANVLETLVSTPLSSAPETSTSTDSSTDPSPDAPVICSTIPPAAPSAFDDFLAQHAFNFSEQMFPSWDFQDQNFEWQLDAMASDSAAFQSLPAPTTDPTSW